MESKTKRKGKKALLVVLKNMKEKKFVREKNEDK